MKKFLILFLCISFSTGAVLASDAFLRRLKICNPYETVYKTNSGAVYKKGILGVYTDVKYLTQKCCYYIQTGPDSYNLCNVSTRELNDLSNIEEKSSCKKVTENEVKEAKMNIVASVGVLLKRVIGSEEIPMEKEKQEGNKK